MKQTQGEAVKQFFDDIAEEYRVRYTQSDILLKYMYDQRLVTATFDLDLEAKCVLDVGAGSGSLYDFLKAHNTHADYYGTDISEKMLKESQIPKSRQFIGNIYDLNFDNKLFDYIFLLGFSNYLNTEEFQKNINTLFSLTPPSGKIIISFSNKSSISLKTFHFFKRHFHFLFSRKRVIGQPFTIYSYHPNQIASLMPDWIKIERIAYFNFSLPFIAQVFPKLGLLIANFLKNRLKDSKLARFFAADYIVFFSKK